MAPSKHEGSESGKLSTKADKKAASPDQARLEEIRQRMDMAAQSGRPRHAHSVSEKKTLEQIISELPITPQELSELLQSKAVNGSNTAKGGREGVNKAEDLTDNISNDFGNMARWAEARRQKKPVKLRLPPELIEKLDSQAELDGLTRNDWIEAAIKNALAPKI